MRKKLTALLMSAVIPLTLLATPAEAKIRIKLRKPWHWIVPVVPPLPPKVTVSNGGPIARAVNKTTENIDAVEKKVEKGAKAAVAVAALPVAAAGLTIAAPFLIGKKIHDVGKDIVDQVKAVVNNIANVWTQLQAALKAYGPAALYAAIAFLGLFALTLFVSLVRNTRDLFSRRAA
jgi:hypothetical protein